MVPAPCFLSIGPLAGGVLAGVLHTILGPDHLCAIMTLSACQGAEAFWFGIQWAGGHLTGMALIGTLFSILRAYGGGIALDNYEHYADYVIGVLLVLFGGYFMLRADAFFDKEWSPKQASCACHPVHGHHGHSHNHDGESHESVGEAERLLPGKPTGGIHDLRMAGSVLVGFVQGVACPAGLVGLSLLKQYQPAEMLIFIGVFFVITTLSMGTLAMAYGMLTRHCVSSASVARCIYYFSCSASMLLGSVWIVLNYTDSLHALLGHDHDHEHGGATHSHDHGHDHGFEHLLFLMAAPR